MSAICVLIGPPGSGKSTVGRLLAQRLNTDFRDTDSDVAEHAGKSIAEIFVEDGEPIFRQMEAAAVSKALREHAGVLALGGGAVMNEAVAEDLKQSGAPVCFLDVSISAAAPRVGFNRDRPLLIGNPRAQWIALMEKRRARYEDLATFSVLTDEKQPGQVVDEVATQLVGRQ